MYLRTRGKHLQKEKSTSELDFSLAWTYITKITEHSIQITASEVWGFDERKTEEDWIKHTGNSTAQVLRACYAHFLDDNEHPAHTQTRMIQLPSGRHHHWSLELSPWDFTWCAILIKACLPLLPLPLGAGPCNVVCAGLDVPTEKLNSALLVHLYTLGPLHFIKDYAEQTTHQNKYTRRLLYISNYSQNSVLNCCLY